MLSVVSKIQGQGQAQSGRPSVFSEEDIDQSIRNITNQIVEELVETFQVHRTTVKRRFESLDFTKMFDHLGSTLAEYSSMGGVRRDLFLCFPGSKMTSS